jgi:hypothetical protein
MYGMYAAQLAWLAQAVALLANLLAQGAYEVPMDATANMVYRTVR